MDPFTIACEIGFTVGLWALNKYVLNQTQKAAAAAYLDSAPTATEGNPLPIVYGMQRVTSPVFMWYGTLQNNTPGDDGNIGVPDGSPIQYGVNMLLSLGLPFGPPQPSSGTLTKLTGMWVGDKKLVLNLTDGQSIRTSSNATDNATNNAPVGQRYQYGASDGHGGSVAVPMGVGKGFVLNQWGSVLGLIQFFGGGDDQRICTNTPTAGLVISGGSIVNPNFCDQSMVAGFMRQGGVDPTTIPGYRNQMLVALTGDIAWPTFYNDPSLNQYWNAFYMGTTPQIAPFSFEVSTYRNTQFLGGAWLAANIQDADPTTVILDVLTSDWGKIGCDPARIDQSSIAGCSAQLLAEKHGYSRVIDQLRDGRDVLQEVVSQIGGVLYVDPVVNLVRLKLIRNDYTVGALPQFTADDVVSVDDYTTSGWRDTINQVRVKYSERIYDYRDSNAVANNMASAVMQDTSFGDVASPGGNVRSVTITYPGCCNYALALQLAARDLNALSQPLSQIKLTMTRTARDLRPGDCFVLTFPDYWIDHVVFRVSNIDLGAPGSTVVQVTATQDIYAAGGAVGVDGGAVVGSAIFRIPYPSPVTVRKVMEVPRWLQQWAVSSGVFTGTADNQHVLALGYPDDGAVGYQGVSLPALALLFGIVSYAVDVKLGNQVPLNARVNTAYGRELGPYDTSTGLVVDSFPAAANPWALTLTTWTPTLIRSGGYNLVLVGDEIVAYETMTDLSGAGTGPWRLNKVWRGLLDTVAHDHAVGEKVWWIGTAFSLGKFLGKVAKPDVGGGVLFKLNATFGLFVGSGEDPVDLVPVVGRHALPAPVGSLGVAGQVMTGVNQQPFTTASLSSSRLTGFYSKVTSFEEGVGLLWYARDRLSSTIVRGDDGYVTPTESTTWEFWAQKTATVPGEAAGALVQVATNLDPSLVGLNELLVGAVGYGDVDLAVRSKLTASGLYEFQPPTVHAYAPRWRNLMGNVRWINGTTGVSPCWTTSGAAISTGTSAPISRSSADYYPTWTGTSGNLTQVVDVTGYKARNMTAWLQVYVKGAVNTGSDSLTFTITALDASNASLGTVTATYASNPTGYYVCKHLSYASLPSGTVKLKVAVTGASSGANIQVYFQEPKLRLGQFIRSDATLANNSFETGSTTSWTNVSNSFVVETTTQSPSQNYARGGAFASSSVQQDYTVPTGWEVGCDAVLTFWRTTLVSGDAGTVQVLALDGGGSTLASATTGSTVQSTGVWQEQRLSLNLPVGTAKVRVLLTATRFTGSLNSGAAFDDVHLSLWKDLSDARAYTVLDFTVPTAQPIAATWQEWHVEHADLFRAGVPHPLVFGGGQASIDAATNIYPTMVWSDGLAHATGVAVGQWGGVSSVDLVSTNAAIDSYVFARGSGALGVDFESTGDNVNARPAAPDGSRGFTAIVLVRVDEDVFGGACGLFGRGDVTGWRLELDAAGHVLGALLGTNGAASSATTDTVTDGAWHMAAVVYDNVAQTITAYSERGAGPSVSTVGVGNVANLDATSVLRVGRSRALVDTLPGMIARAYWFDVALTAPQVAKHWNYAKDPTGLITTYSCPSAGWVPGVPTLSGEETCVCVSADQVGLGYSPLLLGPTAAAITALVTSAATTNLIPSWDFTGASWTTDSGVTLTQGVQDATGQLKGCTVNGGTASNGLNVAPVTVGAGTKSTLVFWGKGNALYLADLGVLFFGITGHTIVASRSTLSVNISVVADLGGSTQCTIVEAGQSFTLHTNASAGITTESAVEALITSSSTLLKVQTASTFGTDWAPDNVGGPYATTLSALSASVQLLNSSGVLKQTVAVPLTAGWARHVVAFTAWDNSTATAVVKFAGSLTMSLSHVMHLEQGATCAAYIPRLPNTSTASGTSATVAVAPPQQFNVEGELEVLAVGTVPVPGVAQSIARAWNGVNNNDARTIDVTASTGVLVRHYDSTATVNAASTVTGIDFSQAFDARARWAYVGLMDGASDFAGVVFAGSLSGSSYGRTATWTYSATQLAQVTIGSGVQANFSGFVRRVVVRAREEKLV